MILTIDTSDREKVLVTIKDKAQILAELSSNNEFGSQVLLPLIKQVLQKANKEFKDLTAIEVNTGPGSYTGLKVGVSVANALGFSLNIPVNGKDQETELLYK